MSDMLDPPSPLAERLFEAERERPDIDGDVAARIVARLDAAIGVGLGDLVSASPKDAPPPPAAPSPTAGLSASAGAATNAGVAAGLTAKAAPWIALAFVTGAGVGAGVHAAVTPRAEAPVVASASAPVVPVAPAGPLEPVASPAEPLEPVASPPEPASSTSLPRAAREAPIARGGPSAVVLGADAGPASSHEPRESRGADLDLAAERALIDRATMALARGQQASALATLDEHASRFSRGRLAEEREALAIRALAQSGRSEEARARAQMFRRTFPASLLMPAVDAVVPQQR